MRFMNLPKEYCGCNSKFLIVPIEYEGKASWMAGAERGAEEIIRASYNLEYYDEQFNVEPFVRGIRTLPRIRIGSKNEEMAVKTIENKILKIGSRTDLRMTFPIFLGGDHSITIGSVGGMEKIYKNFSVIVLDAHSDLRECWKNSRFNHACVSKRIQKMHNLLIIGLRAQDVEEYNFVRKNRNVRTIRAYEYSKNVLIRELRRIGKNVYVSIDADFFDPSFIRYTGTPEPGGFFWNDAVEILQEIFKRKNVIGADIVEFAPFNRRLSKRDGRRDYSAEAFALAKLCYKIIALKQLQESKKLN